MNKVLMNTVSLAKDPIIREGEGGGGGGATINNQEKSVDITENGVTEVTADAGFTGLSKVVVNTNVQSGGAPVSKPANDVNFYDYDGTILHSYTKDEFLAMSAMPPLPEREGLICQEWNWGYEEAQEYVAEYGLCDIGATYITDDGKTRLYVSLKRGWLTPTINCTLSGTGGVIVDWGDGSSVENINKTGQQHISHSYQHAGNYIISIDVAEGCELQLGVSSSRLVLGASSEGYIKAITKAEVGNRTTLTASAFASAANMECISLPKSIALNSSCFYKCFSMKAIVVPKGMTAIPYRFVHSCYSMTRICLPSSISAIGENAVQYTSIIGLALPNALTTISDFAFTTCESLMYLVFPKGIQSIGRNQFNGSPIFAVCDFSHCIAVPQLGSFGTSSNAKIIVPDALYDEWIAATNWSSVASQIIKKSDWDAQS